MQVDDNKEHRSTGGMHIPNQPAEIDVTHDVFDRCKGQVAIRLVIHRQENTGHYLDDKNQYGQSAKVVPEIEILRRVVFCQVLFEQLG